MYAFMWRHLPGPVWVQALVVLALLAAVTVACFGWVFPAVTPFLPFEDITVGTP